MKILIWIIVILTFYSCMQNESQSEISVTDETLIEANISDENQIAENLNKPNFIPVEAYIVKKELTEEKLPFTSILKPVHSVDIISEVSGNVIKIKKELGGAVNKNDVLAIIDDVVAKSNFDQAKAQLLSAENSLKIAKLNLKSDKQLYENGDISQLEYDNSQLAVKTAEANQLAALASKKLMEKQFQDTRIKSPIQGIVARKFIELGTMVNLSMPVYRVVDLNVLKLEIGVPQSFISNVSVGDEAEIAITALKDKLFSGYVKYISPQADESTGAFKTEIHVKNTSDKIIKAGLSSKVNLVLKTKEEQMIVPNYALITKNGDKYLYKIENEMAKLVSVGVGDSYGSKTVVEEGIAEGDTIVVVGMKNLGIETRVWIETLHNQ